MNQKTIRNRVSCSGVGLHSGKQVNMSIKPASVDTGIIFKRDGFEIKASYENVSCTLLGTTISNKKTTVATIEHLMSALWGCEIDNAIVELDGPEIPIMDGSAEPFVFLIECAGIVSQNKPRNYIELLEKIEVKEDNSFITIEPADEFSISFGINFYDKVINKQKGEFIHEKNCFKKDISRARTFGFEKEVFALRSKGLALGGSFDNAIVVGEDKVLNSNGLRTPDEFVRHKMLDCIGDLFLAGNRIKGKVTAYRSGHSLNNKVLKKLFANQRAWRLVPDRTVGVIAEKVAIG